MDKIVNEIENIEVENNYENVYIVFYMIGGDNVDYFVKTSLEPIVRLIKKKNI